MSSTRNSTPIAASSGTSLAAEFDLFNLPPEPQSAADEPAGRRLSARFEAFHDANPHVYDVLVREARAWRNTGRAKCGIDMLYNRARWVLSLETDGEPYRLNDLYRAFYARLIMHCEPDLAGIFDVRESEADGWIAVIKHGLRSAA